MTSSALDIYKLHLTEQLGENGVFTEPAIFDPSGANVTLSGVFDENNFRGNKDAAGVQQKKTVRALLSQRLQLLIYTKMCNYIFHTVIRCTLFRKLNGMNRGHRFYGSFNF